MTWLPAPTEPGDWLVKSLDYKQLMCVFEIDGALWACEDLEDQDTAIPVENFIDAKWAKVEWPE